MIRRLLWLGAGAALGILGYRKLDRLVRTAPRRAIAAGAGRLTLNRPGTRALTGAAKSEAREPGGRAGGFLRDVREGMDEYLNRHASQLGNTLVDQQPAQPVVAPAALRRGAVSAPAALALPTHYRRTAADGVGRDSPSFP